MQILIGFSLRVEVLYVKTGQNWPSKGEECASDLYKATHPNIRHGHSLLDLGARATPIRPLLLEIEENAREEPL